MIFLAKLNHLVFLKEVDGRVYSSTKLIADELNHGFVTSAQSNLTPSGPNKNTDTNTKKYLLPRQTNCIFLSPTTPEEILTLLNGLDSKNHVVTMVFLCAL